MRDSVAFHNCGYDGKDRSMKMFAEHFSGFAVLRTAFFLTLAIFVLSWFCGSSAAERQKQHENSKDRAFEKVTLQLKWFHQFQFAGYYAAKEKGFYRKRGLDVTIVEGGPFCIADVVAAGKAQYGVAGSDILLERIAGKPVVVLASVFQHSPCVLIAKNDGTVSPGIHGLIGKKLMLPVEQWVPEIYAMFLCEGIPLDSFAVFSSAVPRDYRDDSISAYSGYISNEPFLFMKENIPFAIIRPQTYGIDFYGDSLFASETEIRQHSRRVAEFKEASLEGWRYALDHVEEIADLILDKYGCEKSREHLLFEAGEIEKLVEPDVVSLGHVDAGRWRFIAKTMGQLGLCARNVSLDGFVHDPRQAIMERQQWLLKYTKVAGGAVLFLTGAFFIWYLSLKSEVKKRTKALSAEIAERKKAERALLESERKFETAFVSSPAILGISTWEEGRFIEVNKAFCDFLGVRRDEIVGKTSLELDIWDDRDQRRRMLGRLTATGAASAEIHPKSKSGEVKTGILTFRAVEVKGRKLVLSHFLDITEQNKAQEALRESRERYRIVADFTYDWEYWTAPEGRLKFVSPSCERLTGRTALEFLQDPDLLLSIVHDDDKARVEKHLVFSCGKHPDAGSLDFRIVKPGGAIRWVSHYCRPVHAADGSYLGQRASNRDITERRLAEEKLVRSEALFRALTEKSGDLTVILDEDGRIEYASPSATEYLGNPPEQMVGKLFDDFLNKEDIPIVRDMFEKAVGHHEENVPPIEFRTVGKDGRTAHLEALVSNMLDEPGLKGLVANCRDISERKKLELDLTQAQRTEAVGKLAGGIAHDFNNILSSLIGFTELALDDAKLGVDPQKNLREVVNAGVRASELVKQILSFSGQEVERAQSFRVGDLAQEATDLLRAALPTTIDIRRTIDSEYSMVGDPTKIHQVFMNLYTNAAQAMEKNGGVLEVVLEDVAIGPDGAGNGLELKSGPYVKVEVSDTGEGISPDVVGSVFKPYFTTKPKGEGTGMGLSVVREIVEKYGGGIFVESETGKWTRFTFYLPASLRQGPPLVLPAEEPPTGNERIMFIDDDESLANMTGETLRRLGYDVTVAIDSKKAFELFRSAPERFDLVITDMTMPGIAGEKLAASMLEIRPELPVIICTGYRLKFTEDAAPDLGAKALLHKPVVKWKLARTVRDVLDGKLPPNG